MHASRLRQSELLIPFARLLLIQPNGSVLDQTAAIVYLIKKHKQQRAEWPDSPALISVIHSTSKRLYKTHTLQLQMYD